ncbi:MAG: sulfotransferase [Promethearchaeota archaeon]|nr:MAG: sulfotransferase [Candidatus Lokiarchaeota archaeon]
MFDIKQFFGRFTNEVKLSPALGTSLTNWLKLLFKNGFFSIRYIARVVFISLLSIVGVEFRIYEKFRLRKIIKDTEISEPPIFIIGHWRSGTTHLHNILIQDNKFGFISMLQATFPSSFITTNVFKKFLDFFLPEKRPMDNMKLGTLKPQEDELTMSNLSMYSFYNAFYFPRKMIEHFYRYVMFEGIKDGIQDKWMETYVNLLKKATYYMHGRRLILKNPSHTARIPVLLEMFPDAKFIFISRNPYVIYPSMVNFYDTAIKYFILQTISDEEIDKNLRLIYKMMMESYFEDKELIPEGNLIEVRFSELQRDPLDLVERIYGKLNIDGFQENEERFKAYIDSRKSYKKNKYILDEHSIKKIKNSWSSIIKKLDYNVPEDISEE